MPYFIVWDQLCNLCTRNKYLHTYTHVDIHTSYIDRQTNGQTDRQSYRLLCLDKYADKSVYVSKYC